MLELSFEQLSKIGSGRRIRTSVPSSGEESVERAAFHMAGIVTVCTIYIGCSCLRIYYQY